MRNFSQFLPIGIGKSMLSGSPAWAEKMVGGWRLSGIWRYTSRRYFTRSFIAAGGLGNNRLT
jgi:hypothetical protein